MPQTRTKTKTQTTITQLAEEQLALVDRYIPVPVIEIANSNGLDVREFDFEGDNIKNVSGVLLKDDDEKWNIIFNSRDIVTRQRFTIAHELGHFLLHKENAEQDSFIEDSFENIEIFYRSAVNYQNATRRNAEIEANVFAANLLMPQQELEIAFKYNRSIGLMADRFFVSEVAMAFRLRNLGLI